MRIIAEAILRFTAPRLPTYAMLSAANIAGASAFGSGDLMDGLTARATLGLVMDDGTACDDERAIGGV